MGWIIIGFPFPEGSTLFLYNGANYWDIEVLIYYQNDGYAIETYICIWHDWCWQINVGIHSVGWTQIGIECTTHSTQLLSLNQSKTDLIGNWIENE